MKWFKHNGLAEFIARNKIHNLQTNFDKPTDEGGDGEAAFDPPIVSPVKTAAVQKESEGTAAKAVRLVKEQEKQQGKASGQAPPAKTVTLKQLKPKTASTNTPKPKTSAPVARLSTPIPLKKGMPPPSLPPKIAHVIPPPAPTPPKPIAPAAIVESTRKRKSTPKVDQAAQEAGEHVQKKVKVVQHREEAVVKRAKFSEIQERMDKLRADQEAERAEFCRVMVAVYRDIEETEEEDVWIVRDDKTGKLKRVEHAVLLERSRHIMSILMANECAAKDTKRLVNSGVVTIIDIDERTEEQAGEAAKETVVAATIEEEPEAREADSEDSSESDDSDSD
jgi:hypothetical protein